MRKIGSMSSRLMRSHAANADATPEISIADTPATATTAGQQQQSKDQQQQPIQPLMGRASSWRVKSKPVHKASTKQEVHFLCTSVLKNVRESKVAEFFDKPGYLATIEFDNKGLSLDELHIAAVLILEQNAPGLVFSDRQGLLALFDFVNKVRKTYLANPYHDFRHAVDVMQFTNYMLHREEVAAQIRDLPAETSFTTLVACLCHDAGHDGLTNALHRKQEGDALVERFGAESTLERLHFDHCERIVTRESTLLQTLCVADETQFINLCRSLILGTDMEKHTTLLASFRANPSHNLLHMIVKIADISNVTREFEEARVWSRRLDAEVKLHPGAAAAAAAGTGVSMAQSVIGFSRAFALPLAQALADTCLPETGRMLKTRIEANIATWEREESAAANPGL